MKTFDDFISFHFLNERIEFDQLFTSVFINECQKTFLLFIFDFGKTLWLQFIE